MNLENVIEPRMNTDIHGYSAGCLISFPNQSGEIRAIRNPKFYWCVSV